MPLQKSETIIPANSLVEIAHMVKCLVLYSNVIYGIIRDELHLSINICDELLNIENFSISNLSPFDSVY